MVNAKQKNEQVKKIKMTLILTGVMLTFGWAFILAVTTWLADLPCVVAPNNCAQGQNIALAILYAPILVGSFVLPTGVLYDSKTLESAKRATILVSGVLLVIVSFWISVIVGISIHGLY